ncbi:MAG: tetratricopeptide repeat protein [Desulfovibrionaceae bacterium]
MSRTRIKPVDPLELSHAPDALPGGLRCAFSDKKTIKIGAGATSRKQTVNVYWYAEQLGPDEFGLWMLNANYVPTGQRRAVSKAQLLEDFHPELDFYNRNVFPRVVEMADAVRHGDEHRAVGEYDAAIGRYNQALRLDDENVRAVFGLGLSHLGRRDTAKALHVFDDLVKLDAAFEAEHKHLFNEMGIALRKNGLFDQAVEFYGRALDFASGDEHLFYNLARAYYEKGDYPGCAGRLKACLEQNPRLDEALKLGGLVLALAGNPDLRDRHGKPPVPPEARDAIRLVLEAARVAV